MENPIPSVEETAQQTILFSQILDPFYDSEPESESESDSDTESFSNFFVSPDDDDDDYHSFPPSPMATPPLESFPFVATPPLEDFFDSCPMETVASMDEDELSFDAQLEDDLRSWFNSGCLSPGVVSEPEEIDLNAGRHTPDFPNLDLFLDVHEEDVVENFSSFQEMDMDPPQAIGSIPVDANPFSLNVPLEMFDCLPEHIENHIPNTDAELEWDAISTDSSIPDLEDIVSNMEFEVLLAMNNIYEGHPEMDFFRPYLELDRVLRGGTAASRAVVESLPNVTVDESLVDLHCAVCKELVLLGESVKRLPCSHDYHASCILPWLNIKNTCPLCRFELPIDEPNHDSSRAQQENQV